MTHQQREVRRAKIAKAVLDGKTIQEVCAEFRVTITTVRDACRVFEVEIPNTRKSVSSVPSLRMVAELQNTNDTQPEIAKRLGVSKQRVSSIFKAAQEAGIRFPNREQE